MGEQTLAENGNIVPIFDGGADLFAANPQSAWIKGDKHERLDFILRVVGTDAAAATATMTVEAAEDAAGTNAELIPYRLFAGEEGENQDVLDDGTEVLAAGQDTVANRDRHYIISIDTDALPQGKPFVALQLSQVGVGAVRGHATLHAHPSRYKGSKQSIL